jgi:hypothetical protein
MDDVVKNRLNTQVLRKRPEMALYLGIQRTSTMVIVVTWCDVSNPS